LYRKLSSVYLKEETVSGVYLYDGELKKKVFVCISELDKNYRVGLLYFDSNRG